MRKFDRIAIAVSAVTTSVVGGAFVFLYWANEDRRLLGVARAVLFVVIMVLVHWLGYRAWSRHVMALGPAGDVIQRRPLRRADFLKMACGLAVAISCFWFALGEFAVARRIQLNWASRGKTPPPTMLGEHQGVGSALICGGLISLIVGFRTRGFTVHEPPRGP